MTKLVVSPDEFNNWIGLDETKVQYILKSDVMSERTLNSFREGRYIPSERTLKHLKLVMDSFTITVHKPEAKTVAG